MDFLSRLLSWKSSLLGIIVLVSSVGTLLTSAAGAVKALIDGDPTTVPDWSTVAMSAAAVAAAFKLIWHKEAGNPVDAGKK